MVLAIATFANMYVVLTTLYAPEDPALNPVRDWLGIGELLLGSQTPVDRAPGRAPIVGSEGARCRNGDEDPQGSESGRELTMHPEVGAGDQEADAVAQRLRRAW